MQLGTTQHIPAGQASLSSCPILQRGSLRPRETPLFPGLGPWSPRLLGSAALVGAPADQAPSADSRALLAVICSHAHFCFVSDLRRGGRKPRATFQSFKVTLSAGPGEGGVGTRGRPAQNRK